MSRLKLYFLFIIFSLIMFSNINFSQTYGKIYSKSEADSLYGPIHQSFVITRSTIELYITQTDNVLMFKFKNRNLIVLGNGRRIIYSTGEQIDSNDTFSVYSTSIIKELMVKGQTNSLIVEQRATVLTLTDGNFTAEFVPLCPPICP